MTLNSKLKSYPSELANKSNYLVLNVLSKRILQTHFNIVNPTQLGKPDSYLAPLPNILANSIVSYACLLPNMPRFLAIYSNLLPCLFLSRICSPTDSSASSQCTLQKDLANSFQYCTFFELDPESNTTRQTWIAYYLF